MEFLSPKQAATIAAEGMRLVQAGALSAKAFVLLSNLLWRCRPPGTATALASYTRLQRMGHMARQTVCHGLAELERLGLLVKIKNRVRVSWGGATASRQATSAYRFAPISTEFSGRPVFHKEEKKGSKSKERATIPAIVRPAVSSLEEALASLGRALGAVPAA